MDDVREPTDLAERIAAIVDPDLANLGAATLVDELLERVHALLGVDTAAVLVLDVRAQQLVVRAARGLHDTVQPGMRLPVGRGFARRIITERAPVDVDCVDPETVAGNPIVCDDGITSLLGVPLVVSGTVTGVMYVGSVSLREFDDDDSTLLQHAADRTAMAIAAQASTDASNAARTLQRSLLPARLATHAGLEFAARFVPAESFGVGGDWYDTFTLPSGHIGVVVGDIAGSGLPAAVVMGRMRSALRSYALESSTPAEALSRLDAKFAHFEPNQMATVLYLLIDPSLERFTISSAGHLPPVIAMPGCPASFVPLHPDPPVGAHLSSDRADHVIDFPVGCTMASYTDGLVERRHEPLDPALEQLRSTFHSGPVEAVSDAIMTSLVGSTGVEDDTVLLTIRHVDGSAVEPSR